MRAVLNLDTSIKVICKAIKGTRDTSATPGAVKKLTNAPHLAWLPSVMLQVVVPNIVATFKECEHTKRQKKVL
jgi:hypothetical protein